MATYLDLVEYGISPASTQRWLGRVDADETPQTLLQIVDEDFNNHIFQNFVRVWIFVLDARHQLRKHRQQLKVLMMQHC